MLASLIANVLYTTLFASPVFAADLFAATGKLELSNVGFDGSYLPVTKITDKDSTSNICEVGERKWFHGTNAPLNENLAVIIKGPINLYKFAYYTSPNFVIGQNSSSNWNQSAYYDIDYMRGDNYNVTVLGHQGHSDNNLGKALSYLSQDLQNSATTNTFPGQYSKILSNDGFIFFSNVSCPASGVKNGCGVYRKGIPAYYGFGGTTKMFLFEFSMPTDTTKVNTTEEYDSPSISLINDQVPRITARYGYDNNCSCVLSGCGAFSVFQTQDESKDLLYSSLQTYQGIPSDSSYSIVAMLNGTENNGAFIRPRNQTVYGGVVFDSNGTVTTFITDSFTFDSEISAGKMNSILENLSNLAEDKQVVSGTSTAPTTNSASKSNGVASFNKMNNIWFYCFNILLVVVQTIII